MVQAAIAQIAIKQPRNSKLSMELLRDGKRMNDTALANGTGSHLVTRWLARLPGVLHAPRSSIADA
jgi:hypothetical protein